MTKTNTKKQDKKQAKSVALVQKNMRQELVGELESLDGKNVYRVVKQMTKSRQDVVKDV